MLLGTWNFLEKESDPRVPLSCGTGTRTILDLFLKKWKWRFFIKDKNRQHW
jgi:hypothetical protein